MNLNRLLTISSVNNLCARELLDRKNKDYSDEDEVHENFKDMALLCDLLGVNVGNPSGCIMFEIVRKIRRLFKIINSGLPPENESLKDSVIDLENYITLLYTLQVDNEQEK